MIIPHLFLNYVEVVKLNFRHKKNNAYTDFEISKQSPFKRSDSTMVATTNWIKKTKLSHGALYKL